MPSHSFYFPLSTHSSTQQHMISVITLRDRTGSPETARVGPSLLKWKTGLFCLSYNCVSCIPTKQPLPHPPTSPTLLIQAINLQCHRSRHPELACGIYPLQVRWLRLMDWSLGFLRSDHLIRSAKDSQNDPQSVFRQMTQFYHSCYNAVSYIAQVTSV